MKETLTLNSSLTNIGGLTSTTDWLPYQPLVEKYYYQYPIYTYWTGPNKNKVEQAFKIAQILIDKKIIKLDKVKDFIELVNEIVTAL